MLHEILLSLSGHRSPLLHPAAQALASPDPNRPNPLTPPERALLADLARLSELHVRLRAQSARITAQHPSMVCRAVGAAIESVHLAAFQRAVLDAEALVLRRDPAFVGAYDIVPLTAVAMAFADWPPRLEWLWELVQFLLPAAAADRPLPSGARLIDRLRAELQTGYADIEAMARSLVHVAEQAWLKQVSAWILYGQLPGFGGADFFVQKQKAPQPSSSPADGVEPPDEYVRVTRLLPSFVTAATASSMLSIGRSLVHMRGAVAGVAGAGGPHRSLDQGAPPAADYQLSSQLQELARLTYPLDGLAFARAVARIRAVLSRTVLRRLLPPARVVEMLQLLRDFFLLGRGEFAMALVEQADVAMRNRWQLAGHLLPGTNTNNNNRNTPGGLRGMHAAVVKDGEVAAVLARTWAALGAMQAGGRHADVDEEEEEDEGLELARDTLRLTIQRPSAAAAAAAANERAVTPQQNVAQAVASTPFRNLLFSVPVTLTLQIPYPLDLVLSPADLQAYAAIHAYLLSIRRAHIRLTGLWKLTSLRRHHPAPPAPPYGARSRGSVSLDHVRMLRERYTERANALRSMWATSSAAIFFLSETEGYLQAEVVVELWEGFQQWLLAGQDEPTTGGEEEEAENEEEDEEQDEDIWLDEDLLGKGLLGSGPPAAVPAPTPSPGPEDAATSHDPETLATAHRRYLRRLLRGLLLDRAAWTDALYGVLVAMDQLVALVQRLHALWAALDLESDAGVVDAFVDLDREQHDVLEALAAAEQDVRQGVDAAVAVLRELDGNGEEEEEEEEGEETEATEETGVLAVAGGAADAEAEAETGPEQAGLGLRAAGAYVPRRIGGLERLLMKLDFGSWAVGAWQR